MSAQPWIRSPFVLLLACLSACGGGGGGKSPPKGNLTGLGQTAVTIAPKGTASLFGVNLAAMRDGPLWPKLLATIPDEMKKELELLQARCGLDAMNDLDAVVVANDPDMDPAKAITIVRGNWDEDKATRCFAALLEAHSEPGQKPALVSKREGEIIEYSVEGDDRKLYASWIAPDTVVTASTDDRAWFAGVMAGGATVKDDEKLMAVLSHVDTEASVWAAGTSNPYIAMAFGSLPAGLQSPQGFYATVRLGEVAQATIGLRLDSQKNARSMKDKLAAELKAGQRHEKYGPYLAKATVAPAQKDVLAEVELTRAQVETLLDKAKPHVGTVLSLSAFMPGL